MTTLLTIGQLARRSGVPFRTIRFWNDEVETNIDGVCMTILLEARGRLGR